MIIQLETAEQKAIARWKRNKKRLAKFYHREFLHEDTIPSPTILFDIRGIESKCTFPRNVFNRYHRKIIIAVNKGYTDKALCRTYLHELTHAYRFIDYTYLSNAQRRAYEEVIAETVVMLILGKTNWSFRYVAGWGNTLPQPIFDAALRVAGQLAIRIYDNWEFHLEHFESAYFAHINSMNSFELRMWEPRYDSLSLKEVVNG